MYSKWLTGELATEFKTVSCMIKIYCRHHHQGKPLCSECQHLRDYAEVKLDRCPYGQDKPTCNRCPIHCYKKAEKQQMKTVMRYAGPRMLLFHPFLAFRHLYHERKAVPSSLTPKNSNRHKRLAKSKADNE
ncbi:nitrous oxide-stimulated promoter family protein [Salinivibrio sp. ML290]|uniref:nitrous oxide-stimulated promoter family protein n=1 Tax=Salinivibrio sp. ML290 TaxID=1909468 RepID=UPI0009885D5C|nr:nitrous oxide-stimulated promoter family protein [Salinivibrio sp. ML290]OOE72271.1 hypothetical protein BZG23_14910 [Salinivibrio sp. ML290]